MVTGSHELSPGDVVRDAVFRPTSATDLTAQWTVSGSGADLGVTAE